MSDDMAIVAVVGFVLWLISFVAVLRLFPIAKNIKELTDETRLLRRIVAAQIPGEILELWRCGLCGHEQVGAQEPADCEACHAKAPAWLNCGFTKLVEITAVTVKPK